MRKHVLVLPLIAVSAAVWASSVSAINGPKTFSLLEISTGNSEQPMGDFRFDRPPVGGDAFAVTNTLYTWAGNKKGARVGYDEVMITFITGFAADVSRGPIALFVAQVYLPGGTILAQGYGQFTHDGPQRWTFPVTGGTGTYANARGYVRVRDLGDGNQNKTNLEFHLMP